VVNGGTITVRNRAPDLQVVVKEVGGIDILESFDNPIVEFDFEYSAAIKTILLPKQGVQLMFVRRDAAPEPTVTRVENAAQPAEISGRAQSSESAEPATVPPPPNAS
jgi:hypothetical protein